MNTKGTKSNGGEQDFNEFWNNFQPFPFKWANRFINQSRYLFLTVAIVYLLLAFMTFFPAIGGLKTMVLISFPSFNIIFIGWIAVIMLTVRWRHKIPVIFQWLWENERLGAKNAELKNEYKLFLQEYQSELLSKKNSLFISVSLVILFFVLAVALKVPQFLYFVFSPIGGSLFFVILLIALFWIFLIGLVGWLIVSTSIYIGKLTQRFSIQIQPSHPDGCGGLKPLGDFCFSAVTPLIVGGLFLTLIPVLRLDDLDLVMTLASTFALFLVAAPLTLLTIYLAFWNIHSSMVEHKMMYADQIAGQIIFLEKEIFLNTSEAGELAKAKTAKEKLEILQSLHPDKVSYPVWPFKVTSTALLVFSPQILQTLIGIVTTVYSVFFK